MIREIYPPKKVFIKYINQQKGWGVFCSEKILKGEIVEQGSVEEVFLHPAHEYTQRLMNISNRS